MICHNQAINTTFHLINENYGLKKENDSPKKDKRKLFEW